jgi:hypothetical protein
MTYTVRILLLNQSEPPPSEQMDGTFATVREAWDAGSAEVLAYQLRSIEAAFQVLDANGQIVEVTAEQANG